jgi:DNA-binding protein HU-beta
MNKTDLIDAVAKSARLSKKDTEVAINAVLDTISDALVKEEKVVLVGFGTFEVRKRAARKGRNPSTKEEIHNSRFQGPCLQSWKRP